GIAIKEGTAVPDIATPEAFKRLITNARAIAFSDPGVGGSAGVYLARLFEEMGLAATVKAKGMPQQAGAEGARRVAERRADIALPLRGEFAAIGGVTIAGPLPPPLGNDTLYCAAVWTDSPERVAAQDFIAALTVPSTRTLWTKAGFDLPGA